MIARMLTLLTLVLLALPAPAGAGGVNWDIDALDVAIEVDADGSMTVTERIVADFTRERHRGLLRDIPYAYRRHGTDFRVRLDVESITDDNGNPHPYASSRSGGMLRLKIGDPNVYRSDRAVYVIRYRVERGLLAFDTHDELYWNAIGPEWAVPIRRASCTIVLPEGAFDAPESARAVSFAGPSGSDRAGPEAVITDEGHLFIDLPRGLPPWNGLTVVAGFPTGVVASATPSRRLAWFLADNMIVLAPVVVFVLLLVFWRWFGRDLGRPGSVAVQYEPPDGLTPVEVGALIDERVDNADITATIIDLAVRGHLRIEAPLKTRRSRVTRKRLRLVRTNQNPSQLKPFEQEIIIGLFRHGDEVQLEDLEVEFYQTLRTVRWEVYEQLRQDGYFGGHLGVVRPMWFVAATLAAIVTVVLGAALLAWDVFAPLSTIIAAVCILPQLFIFAALMPRKTARGRKALEQIKGLEEYISRAELEQLEEAAKRQRFETLLPHAMALGLSTVWAKHFRDLYTKPPEWFDTHVADGYNTGRLVSHLNRSSRLMTRSLALTPRTQWASNRGGSSWSSGGFGGGSSGFSGGSVGGGGGGGGGGAW